MRDAVIKSVAAGERSHDERDAAGPPQAQDPRPALQPAGAGAFARMQTYELEEADGMTLFIALNEIREKQDASLQFDFVCRAGHLRQLRDDHQRPAGPRLPHADARTSAPKITLAPLPVFELIGDLSVNTGKWMRAMSERLQTWVHMKDGGRPARLEERMEPELAEKIYELDRCIECGCCVAGCGTARMREDFVGAVGLNKIARFRLDPRDTRTDDDFYELIGDDDGVFGCMSLLACHDVCPKQLPLATQIAFMRRKMAGMGWK